MKNEKKTPVFKRGYEWEDVSNFIKSAEGKTKGQIISEKRGEKIYTLGQPVFIRYSYDVPLLVIGTEVYRGNLFYHLRDRAGNEYRQSPDMLSPLRIESKKVAKKCFINFTDGSAA